MADKSFTLADLNEGFVVAIQIDAKPGEEETVAEGMARLVEPTMAEPGVKLFRVYRSPTDPKSFFVFEFYRDEAGWAEHQQTDHFKTFVHKIVPRIARRERVPYVPFLPNA